MAIGYLDDKGDPTLEIEILGAFNRPTKFACLIDTGFDGFLSVPILQAFPVGLVLHTTTSVTFANGTSEDKLTCLGYARLDGEDRLGLILIESQSNQVVLGMDFLKKFGLKLIVCPTSGQVEVVPAASNFTVPAGALSPPPPAALPTTSPAS